MSLLSPLFLAGALLIAGPIIFHLIRRATKDRIRFSATQFLRESPPRLERKSRIQNPWLLALRCLVIGLLAFAFGRPFIESNLPISPNLSPPETVALIIDTSASMQRQGAWDNAIAQASAVIRDLDSIDRLSILSASSIARPLVTFDRWEEWPVNERHSFATSVLEDLAPMWGSTRLDDAIDLALAEIEQVDERSGGQSNKRIVLISDVQESARIAGIAGREWPDGCLFEIEEVAGASSGNTGLRWLGWTGEESNQRKLRIGIQSSGVIESPERTLQLLDAASGTLLIDPIQVYANSGDTNMVLLEIPEGVEGPFKVELLGDSEPFDDILYIAEERPRPMDLHYYGDIEKVDNPNESAFYLKRATAGWEDPRIAFEEPSQPDNSENQAEPFILIDSVLDKAAIESLRQQVGNGSHALMLISSPEQIDTAQALFGESGWSASKPERSDSRLGTIDFEHPTFNLFADPRFSDFSRIRFWHSHALRLPTASEATIVAQYDDESPALIEKRNGKGLITLWVGDWSPNLSQWPLSSKFVPWLQRLVERAAGGADQPSIASIDAVASQFSSSTAQWQALGDSSFTVEAPQSPGIYKLKDGRSERLVAFHISPEESEWETHTEEEWEKLGAPLSMKRNEPKSSEASESELRSKNAVELESQQQIWRWIIIAVVALLAFESLIARRLQNREETALA